MAAPENRRKHARIPLHLRAPIRIEGGGRSSEMTGEISNVSQGGLLLKIAQELPAKAHMRVRILWPPGRTCLASGQIVWQRPGSAGVALERPNDDFLQLVRALEISDEAERREIVAMLRSPLLQIDAPPA